MPLLALLVAGAAGAILTLIIEARRSRSLAPVQHRYEQGMLLMEEGRPSEAIAVFDTIIAEDGDATKDAIRAIVANSMLQKAEALRGADRPQDAVATCWDVDRRFGGEHHPGLQLAVCRALLLRAQLAVGPGNSVDPAVGLIDELISRFDGSRDRYMVRVVAESQIIKAGIVGENGRLQEAFAILAQVVAAASQQAGTQADVVVVSALTQRGSLLEAAGDLEAALITYRASRERAARNPALRLAGEAGALGGEGRVLQALGRPEEALAKYEEILSFDELSRPLPRRYLVDAAKGKVDMLWKLGRREEALSGADQLVRLARTWGDNDLLAETSRGREWMVSRASQPERECLPPSTQDS